MPEMSEMESLEESEVQNLVSFNYKLRFVYWLLLHRNKVLSASCMLYMEIPDFILNRVR